MEHYPFDEPGTDPGPRRCEADCEYSAETKVYPNPATFRGKYQEIFMHVCGRHANELTATGDYLERS